MSTSYNSLLGNANLTSINSDYIHHFLCLLLENLLETIFQKLDLIIVRGYNCKSWTWLELRISSYQFEIHSDNKLNFINIHPRPTTRWLGLCSLMYVKKAKWPEALKFMPNPLCLNLDIWPVLQFLIIKLTWRKASYLSKKEWHNLGKY